MTGKRPESSAGRMKEQVSGVRAWGRDKTSVLLETRSGFVKR